jgi:hypothetical protein
MHEYRGLTARLEKAEAERTAAQGELDALGYVPVEGGAGWLAPLRVLWCLCRPGPA